jgi:AcrR family transcriptional regulator
VRRTEIIDVAHAVIMQEGYRALSLREVARRCGMSAPGLMHYFPDMPSLLEAVLAHRDDVDIAAIVDATRDDHTLVEVFDGAMAYYADRTEETRRFDALEAEALDPNHPAHEWFEARNRRNFELLRPYVEREFEEPETAMRLLRYLMDGLRLSWIRRPDRVDIDEDRRALLALVDALPRRADAPLG